jgi:hypothetical protein
MNGLLVTGAGIFCAFLIWYAMDRLSARKP